jgi:hypothetical protein
MFTLKLYQNQIGHRGRTVVMECVGVWADRFSIEQDGPVITQLTTFKKRVGIDDEEGSFNCYVGGSLPSQFPPDCAIIPGAGGNYYDWGVLENAQGKTTEMFR